MMTSRSAILLKSLQTSSRCLIQSTSTTTCLPLTRRTFALYTGSQFKNTLLLNKESGLRSTDTIEASTSDKDSNKTSEVTESTEAYHVPKIRQTVYSAQDDDIETAGPVNRLY